MAADYNAVFASLKAVLAAHTTRMAVKSDTPDEYTLVAKIASPFPQHKGQPMFFGSVRLGKAYVSLHLMPLYMNPPLAARVSPALKKRMQGKACFNFKAGPDPELLAELNLLTDAAWKDWRGKNWI